MPAPNFFVLPAYNEEANIGRLLADLEARPDLYPAGSRVIVVDDGSEDRTADVVEAYRGPLPVELVRLATNQGPGAAFRAGFEAALESSDEVAFVVTLESDTTSDLDALPAMLERARDGAELVLADWRMVNVPRFRRALSHGAGWFMRAGLGVQAHTVSSFFRVYRAAALREAFEVHGDALILESGFACKAEILMKLDRLGARIAEVPVSLDSARRIGASKMPLLRTAAAYGRLYRRSRARAGVAP
jgi:dolichol-phosphate mannosyltransferase